MKSLLLITAAFVTAGVASAQTYNCGELKDPSGEPLLGGPGYQIQYVQSTGKAYLITTEADTGRITKSKVEMKKEFQGVEAADWQADGITMTAAFGHISISSGQDSADCTAN